MKELLRKLGSEAILAFLTIGAIPWTVWTTRTLFQLQEDIAVIRAVMTQQATYKTSVIPRDFQHHPWEHRTYAFHQLPIEFVSSLPNVR